MIANNAGTWITGQGLPELSRIFCFFTGAQAKGEATPSSTLEL